MNNAKYVSAEEEEKLNAFLLDTSLLKKLDKWLGKFNIFDTLGISRWEIKHSNLLAWLLTPSEKHGIGNQLLDGLIIRLVENNKRLNEDALALLLLNTANCDVQREWKDIDILISSSQASFVIAIENKVGSHESPGQLEKYYKIVEQDFVSYTHKIYVYLTPDGDEASDPENWKSLSYQDIVEVLEPIVTRANLDEDVIVLLNHYISNIRRNIVKDKDLEKICNEIYKKHRIAIDLINNHKTIGKSLLYNAIESVINEYASEGILLKDDNYPYIFRTNKMNSILQPLNEPTSSWNNKHLYQYWFNCYEDRDQSSFYLIFELGGLNVPPAEDKVMKRLIDEYKPSSSRDTFKYFRIYKTKKYTIKNDEDEYKEAAEKAARLAIEELLKMEDTILNKIGS